MRTQRSGAVPRRPHGLGLIEFVAALAVGLFLVAVALTVLARTNSALRVIDAHARMHETARLALSVIETDVRMAGYWSLAHGPGNVAAHPSFAFPARCGGASWVTSVTRPIDGTNNRYLRPANCAASGGGALAGSDALVVRRASARLIALSSVSVPAAERDEVLLISTRERAEFFVAQATGNEIPAGYPLAAANGLPAPSELRAALVHAYYVSVDSSLGVGVPALRRKVLVGGPTVSDEEIAPGIDDLQFRIGADVDGDGMLDSYFEPEAVPPAARPVLVRVWLRVRGVARTGTSAASAASVYADRSWPAINDGYDRLLVSKTIHLRNSRP